MMDDLVKQEVVEKLRNQQIDSSFNDQTLVVSGVIDGTDFELYHYFSFEFPFEIPEFKLSERCLPSFLGLPHVSPSGNVCAYDNEKSLPNIYNPLELVVEVVNKTVNVLTDSFRGKLQADYTDEFLAYWNLGAEAKLADAFVEFGTEPLTLFACTLKNHGKTRWCIAPTKENAKQLLSKIEPRNSDDEVIECCYIPLRQPLDHPLPTSHLEWMKVMQSNSDYYNYYQHFLQKNTKKACLIVFSQPYKNELVIALFSHNALRKVNGFRNDRVPLNLALSSKDGNVPVKRYLVNDASQQRLFFRAGTGSIRNAKVGIIGCGSLGGFLSDSLASYGNQNFILIDNDLLCIENIARHLCGFSYLLQNKAVAVKSYLESHNPNITCQAIEENAHLVLSGASDLFDDVDVLFITAAYAPLELHAVKQMVGGSLKSSLVLLWLEPYALAAHALVLNQPQDISSLFYDANLEFLSNIVINGEELFKREAGCQSSFVQYSGIDSRAFVIDFLREYYQRLSIDDNKNYHYIWIGNLKAADGYGALIHDGWKNVASYSGHLERIS